MCEHPFGEEESLELEMLAVAQTGSRPECGQMAASHKRGRRACEAAPLDQHVATRKRRLLVIGTLGLILSFAPFSVAAGAVAPTPPTTKEVLGREVGSDEYLADYDDAIRYLRALAAQSSRVKLVDAGKTARGLTMTYAVISSPENLAHWDAIKAASRALADPRKTSEQEADQIAKRLPIIVHIDGGPHSNEEGAQQLPLALAESLVRADDGATRDLLDHVVLVLWPTLNPDGQNEVVHWYRRNAGTRFEVAPLPDLYQEYSGHDNNRDAFMLNLAETRVVNDALLEYAPAIFYSLHQRARFPTRIWMPPFVDPVSAAVSPTTRKWTDVFGTKMMMRFVDHDLAGATTQGRLDNWYPGSYDSLASWRHTIGLFTETALYEYATPKCYDRADFTSEFADLAPRATYPLPWRGGCWHLSDAVNYMTVASRSVLETAMENREQLLLDRYRSAQYAVATPARVGIWAYAIPPEQLDQSEARQLVSILARLGIEVFKTPAAIVVGKQSIAQGSWIVPLDQPLGNLAADLLGVQRYPGALLDDKGEVKSPVLGTTAWTLPLKMGVTVEPISAEISVASRASFVRTSNESLVTPIMPSGTRSVTTQATNAGYRFANLALASGGTVSRTAAGLTISSPTSAGLAAWMSQSGVQASGPLEAGVNLRPARIGLYRAWLPSMDEGWTRLVLERHLFRFKSLRRAEIVNGHGLDHLDVVIIPDMSGEELLDGFKRGSVPDQFAGGLAGAGLSSLRHFIERGGTVIAHNEAAAALVRAFDLPIEDVRRRPGASELSATDAILRIDRTGRSNGALAMTYNDGPIFQPGATFIGSRLCDYPASGSPLLSGAGRGFSFFKGAAACLDAVIGKGHLILFGFRPMDRAQTHVTFPLEFEHLYLTGSAR